MSVHRYKSASEDQFETKKKCAKNEPRSCHNDESASKF